MREILAEICVYALLILAICFFTVCGWLGVEVDE